MTTRSRPTASSPSSTSEARSPYDWKAPREAEVAADPLRLRLDFHEESVLVHEYEERLVRTKRVSALDVAHALARGLDLSTGILPADALWWTRRSTGTLIAIWREPRVWEVRLRTSYQEPPYTYRLPMPGLVFVCSLQRPLYVLAAKERPTEPQQQLYHCPTYNTFAGSGICWGTHAFPANPSEVPEAFFESYFSAGHGTGHGKSRKYPDDIGKLWAELDGRDAYPVDDLVELMTVERAMGVGR